MKKTVIKNDIIIIFVFLLIAAVSLLIVRVTRKTGGIAVVSRDGSEICRMNLDEEQEKTFENDNSYNTVVIHDGTASVSDAGCPDKICVHTGAVSYNGETIVCLPNKLTVTIVSDEELFDSVAD